MKEDFSFYKDQSYLTYEYKLGTFTSKDISEWKSTGIYNYSSDSNMNAVANTKSALPNLVNYRRMHVHLSGNHFQQNVVNIPNIPNIKHAINIYCVYELDPIDSSRDTSFTIQNALFGAMQITKNATYNVQVNKYSGSCNTLDNPMAKLCVIKGVNVQVYNFLMMLNETGNVLWHESCKCVRKLNSSMN